MPLRALTFFRALSALLLTELLPGASTVLGAGMEQREAVAASILASSRLVGRQKVIQKPHWVRAPQWYSCENK